LAFIAVENTLGFGAFLSGGSGRDGRVGVVLRIGEWVVLVPTAIGVAPSW
jgi:hypothetical protein